MPTQISNINCNMTRTRGPGPCVVTPYPFPNLDTTGLRKSKIQLSKCWMNNDFNLRPAISHKMRRSLSNNFVPFTPGYLFRKREGGGGGMQCIDATLVQFNRKHKFALPSP